VKLSSPVNAAKAGLIRGLAEGRTDPVLFRWSYDFVGDLAETVALIWPGTESAPPPSLSEIVDALTHLPKAELPARVAAWLDGSSPAVRYAILKLITGALRVGASARLAKTALADLAAGHGQVIAPDDIEEVWHGLAPPYAALFDWIEGRAGPPDPREAPVFRPMMLAHPLEAPDLAALRPAEYAAEWKWDGIRVQLVGGPGGRRVFSRGAEDVSPAFPDIVEVLDFHAVLDGELLVLREGVVAPFADLQQRLNRKSPSGKLIRDFPVWVRLYDILFDGAEDLRRLDFQSRRPHGSFAGDRFHHHGPARRYPRSGTRGRHRRPDVEAARQPVRGWPSSRPVVEMETRSAHHRCGDDVCAARPRQAQ
jgi:DNA ligase-1